jgi:FOG: PKD repeat
MRNWYSKLLLSILLVSAFKLNAQVDIAIGTGTAGNSNTTYPCPLQDYFEGARAQYLFRASELIAAGMGPGNINAIKFNVVSLATSSNTSPHFALHQQTFKIGTTTANTLDLDDWVAGTTTVYGAVDYTPVLGINTFTFTTPFFWNGVDNIVVEMCNGDPGNDTATFWTGNAVVPWTEDLPFDASHTYRVDNSGNLCDATTTSNTGTSTTRPNIIFNWTAAAACTGAPVAGTANTSKTMVCLGEPFTLHLSGVTVASGLSYQWQSSTDNTNWTNITGATRSSLDTSQSVTSWYRAIVTCTASGGADTSTVVQVTSPSLVSGVFTIDKNSTTPGVFHSFNEAYSYIKCGINGPVVFNVEPGSGPYDEQLVMLPVPGASGANTVTFNGNGNTISFATNVSAERAVIKLNGADHIIFDSLVIEPTGTSQGFGVQLINDADSNTIRRCVINVNTTSTSTAFAGLVVSSSHTSATGTGATSCDYNTFTGNTITGGYYGFTQVASNTASNGNNKFVGNTIQDFYQYGMYIYGSFNTLVDSNFISRPTRSTVSTFYGIYVTNLSARLNITRNRITNPFGGAESSTSDFYGINFSSVDALTGLDNIVTNNLIYNITGNGNVYGLYNSSSDNVLYYHNTVALDGAATASTNSHSARGFYQTSQADGIIFKNNIIAITRGGIGSKYAIYFNTPTSTIESNRNNFYIASATGNRAIGFLSADRVTLPDWQTASLQDTNSLTVNPVFTNPLTGDYRPVSASVDNLGLPEGISIDITGLPRSATTPDIGAYEFTPPPCTAPPTPGVAHTSQSPVCAESKVQLTLTDNSLGLQQTYQWQVATDAAGPYTNLGSVLVIPDTVITVQNSAYYRCAVTCSGMTSYSQPVFIEVTPRLPGDTYTINPTGTGPKNYVSFAAAREAMKCGIAGPIVFEVTTGIYNEQLILDSIPGSSAVNTITFKGNGATIAFSSDESNERAVIKLRSADHVTFDSLIIDATGSGSYGYGVQLINDADSNTFRNCTIRLETSSTSTNYSGIVINSSETGVTTTGNTLCDGNTFDGNTIQGGYYAITLVGSSANPLSDNRIINNTIQDYYYYGVYISYTTNTLVEKNDISRPTRTTVGYSYSIYATNASNNLRISKNRIHNPFSGNLTSTNYFYGVYFTGADAQETTPNIISNNIFYDIEGNGDVYGLYNSSSDNARYYHNTISFDYQGSTHSTSYWTRGIYQTGDATGLEYKNNIITISRSGSGTRHAIYMSTTSTTYTSDYNDYYVVANSNTSAVGYNGANQVTLADWQAATSQDAHSISMDPIYADPSVTFNFTPVVSPLDNSGTPAGIDADILDVARSATTPDMGAYEFTIPPCVNPPVAGASVANPGNGICLGTMIQLTLSGNTSGGNQTYQWQAASSAAGPWTDISDIRYVKEFSTELSMQNFFRCKVVCGDTSYSTPVEVVMNPPFLAGTYTIDPGQAPSATNFTSFASAVAALECGITGHVYFNVAPGTYTEQIRMRRIYGSGHDARVTFQSDNGDATSVTLTYDAGSTANYVLQLDSASFITYKNLSIVSVDNSYGRVVELANTASYDSIVNCILTAPAVTSTSNNLAVVFADGLQGDNNVIKGNTISRGSNGIHFEGESARRIPQQVIDSNTISGTYQHGVYVYYSNGFTINRNKVTITAPANSDASGLYIYESDSAYQVNHNQIEISNVAGTKRGIYFQYGDASLANPGQMKGNIVTAVTGITGTIYGISNSYAHYQHFRNNVVTVKNTGSSSSYGLYISGGSAITCYNNSVNSSSTTTSTTNAAAYFSLSSATNGVVNIRNNVFAHHGGAVAYYVSNPNYIYSDYNMFYTSGDVLIDGGGDDYADIHPWRAERDQDIHSIVYKPAFINESDLHPDVANADVWAMHGRGVQIEDNDRDINDSIRPTTLTAGVPDLGAYEFVPTSTPPVLPAIPATPAPGVEQAFMFGTDTVMKITWAPASTVPSSIEVRRYSGVIPPGLAPGQDHMYFYTDVDVTPGGPFNYSIQQFYLDPWQGFIASQPIIKLGRTNSAGEWLVDSTSLVDDLADVIGQTGLDSLDKFTGLTDGKAAKPPVPPYTSQDSSNRGTQFWVAYGHHYNFSSNDQDMVLYLSAEDSANVTVRINGTSWVRHYAIPAGTVTVSDLIPKAGLSDARITDEGLFDRAISITSDVPIVAYAHIYATTNSGATMLLPVGTYGYEYVSLNSRQYYPTGGAGSYSWFYVVADHDSTLVEITPSVTTRGGKPANTPFTVMLNRGQVYNVMGTINGATGTDLTGSIARSLPNASGKCYPIAVFSGSSRTAICYNTNGDNMIQQVFPSQAWGKKYLAFATANASGANNYNSNIFRVMVKDTATDVHVNGNLLPHSSLIQPGNYYQFNTTQGNGPNGAVYVEGSQPILVAQYMVSSGANECPGVTAPGNGDPELIYISPVEQGIKRAAFYNTEELNIVSNYINIIVPDGGLPTLTVDGSNTFSDVFAHPYLPGYTCVRLDLGGNPGQHTVACDSAFTAITYGLGSAESYGYNAGTLVKNLQAISSINNIYDTINAVSEYTCSNTKFKFNILLPIQPTSLTWKLSEVSDLAPNHDVVQNDPQPVDSLEVNGQMYYKYTIDAEYSFAQPGNYQVPIYFTHPSFESCNNSRENILVVKVIASPVADFTMNFSGCAGSPAQFNGAGTTSNGVVVNKWTWNFGGQDSTETQNPTYTFNSGGTYDIKLSVIGLDGCVGDTVATVEVNEAPAVEVVSDSLTVCAGETASFEVQDPVSGATYHWYDAQVGGTVVATGVTFDIPNITGAVSYYVEAVKDGCSSVIRKKVTAWVAPVLTAPIVQVDSLAVNLVRFKWEAVPDAAGYEVSTNDGMNWTPPSSGTTGLTHTVAGLLPLQTVNLLVKAIGGCEDVISAPATAKALPDGVFIPNSFTPNGDGLNDVLQVYGYVIKDLHFMVFNQWGEKLHESRRQNNVWDGYYKGKLQPSGVYMYVCRITLNDGAVISKKGSINLIR